MLHIEDATTEAIKAGGIEKVALLGTRFTMEEDLYMHLTFLINGILM
jgi:aspartate racemase